MSDRFDLEQQILQTWRITEDIYDLLTSFDTMSHDERYNYLIGLQTIYNTKFEKLWATFEDLVYTGQFTAFSANTEPQRPQRTLDEAYDEVDS